jgi:hypothetical protein
MLYLITIDSTSASEIWAKLTPGEQKEFLKLMETPDSDLAKRLLASEELLNDSFQPWWETPSVSDDPLHWGNYGRRPKAFQIPSSLVKASPTGTPLLYNIIAIW